MSGDATDAFAELERACARSPEDPKARVRLLQAFFARGRPDDLPGCSLPLPVSDHTARVVAITPYYQESLTLLERCHRSVVAQTVRCDHVFVADGHPRDELDAWSVRHLRLSVGHRDSGDTPRRIGGQIADAENYDAVVYLDADNWFRPRHVESLLACHRATGAPLCHSARTLHRPDASTLPLWQRGDNVEHVDTSCLFVARAAFDLLAIWGTWPRELALLDDRMLWRTAQARGHRHAFTGALTSCYEATHLGIYRSVGEPPPPGTRPDFDLAGIIAWHAGLPDPERAALDRQFGFSVTAFIAELDTARRG